jgi:hypothetical protein
MYRPKFIAACAAAVVAGVATIASSQDPARLSTASQSTSTGDPALDAEREEIWNSPTMLRARAWVQEYCRASAKITPAEARQYMTEMANMTPTQMKVWLLKFEAEESMIRQQQAAFNRSRQAGVSQAIAYQSQTQQELADVNRDENAAAQDAQQSIDQQQQLAAERDEQNVADRDASEANLDNPMAYGPYGPYGLIGSYPYGGYNPWAGAATHVHIHVHPR